MSRVYSCEFKAGSRFLCRDVVGNHNILHSAATGWLAGIGSVTPLSQPSTLEVAMTSDKFDAIQERD